MHIHILACVLRCLWKSGWPLEVILCYCEGQGLSLRFMSRVLLPWSLLVGSRVFYMPLPASPCWSGVGCWGWELAQQGLCSLRPTYPPFRWAWRTLLVVPAARPGSVSPALCSFQNTSSFSFVLALLMLGKALHPVSLQSTTALLQLPSVLGRLLWVQGLPKVRGETLFPHTHK